MQGNRRTVLVQQALKKLRAKGAEPGLIVYQAKRLGSHSVISGMKVISSRATTMHR